MNKHSCGQSNNTGNSNGCRNCWIYYGICEKVI